MLPGYGVTVELHGETFISKAGITTRTFTTVPDAPFASFELTLPEGPYSALAANGNLCSLTKTVTVKKKVTVRSKGHKTTVTRSIKEKEPTSLADADRIRRSERRRNTPDHPDQRHRDAFEGP